MNTNPILHERPPPLPYLISRVDGSNNPTLTLFHIPAQRYSFTLGNPRLRSDLLIMFEERKRWYRSGFYCEIDIPEGEKL